MKHGPAKVPQDRGSGAPQKTHSFLLDWEPFIIHLFLPHPAADFFFCSKRQQLFHLIKPKRNWIFNTLRALAHAIYNIVALIREDGRHG